MIPMSEEIVLTEKEQWEECRKVLRERFSKVDEADNATLDAMLDAGIDNLMGITDVQKEYFENCFLTQVGGSQLDAIASMNGIVRTGDDVYMRKRLLSENKYRSEEAEREWQKNVGEKYELMRALDNLAWEMNTACATEDVHAEAVVHSEYNRIARAAGYMGPLE